MNLGTDFILLNPKSQENSLLSCMHRYKASVKRRYIIIIETGRYNARPGESGLHPISTNTQAPKYIPTERKKR